MKKRDVIKIQEASEKCNAALLHFDVLHTIYSNPGISFDNLSIQTGYKNSRMSHIISALFNADWIWYSDKTRNHYYYPSKKAEAMILAIVNFSKD